MRNETQTMANVSYPCSKHDHRLTMHEAGQLRRAKMHAAHLISNFNSRKTLSPALPQLLEASIILGTTNSKVLATRLKRKPAKIRAGLQKICHLLAGELKF